MHPTCQHILPLLQLYVDDELAELESDDVENHIEVCTSCAEVLANEFTLRRALRDGHEGDCAAPQRLKENLQAWLSLQSVREDEGVNDSDPIEGARATHLMSDVVEDGHHMPFRGLAIGGMMVAAAALLFLLLPPAQSPVSPANVPSAEAPQPALSPGLEEARLKPTKRLPTRIVRDTDDYPIRMNLVEHRGRPEPSLGIRSYGHPKNPSIIAPTGFRGKDPVFRPTLLHHDSARPRLRVVREWKPASNPVNLVHFPLSH